MATNLSATRLVDYVAVTPEEQTLNKAAQLSLTEDGSKSAEAKPILLPDASRGSSSKEASKVEIDDTVEDSSSESDSDLDESSAFHQPTLSERRKIQNLKFNSLLV